MNEILTKPCCANCKHWNGYVGTLRAECRLNPPITVQSGNIGEAVTKWPVTAQYYKCSQWSAEQHYERNRQLAMCYIRACVRLAYNRDSEEHITYARELRQQWVDEIDGLPVIEPPTPVEKRG